LNYIRGGTTPYTPLDRSSTWTFNNTNIALPPPTLDIMIYPRTQELTTTSRSSFILNGRQSALYNTTYILSHGSCKPSETYQWGFSYIFLFMMSIFNFVWACIMAGMWFDTRLRSRLYKSGRRPGLLRSIVEFAAVVREEVGEGVDELHEEELKQRLRESTGRLFVPKGQMRVCRVETENAGDKGWKRRLTKGSTS
jgi:hypothetical protein